MILDDLSRKSNILSSRIEFIQAKGEKVIHSRKTMSVRANNTDLPLEWKIVKEVGPGLINMGNTCFLNSVLQCLTYIPALAQTLSNSRHKCASASSCTLFAMEEHIKLMNHASKNVVPKAILSKLGYISKALKLGRQEDAHEFLLGLLDSMQKNCFGRKSDPSSTVKCIFDGSIQSIVKCRGYKHESKTTDPIMDIALDIKHCHDIKTAFSHYTKNELLTGGNRYFCERCKKQVDAQKQLKILKEPSVLLIQLKRFVFSENFGSKKNNNHVAFGEELDLDPYIQQSKNNVRYQLIGVVVHAGYTTNSGHYYSFIKSSHGVWYCMDDSDVSQVSLSTVLSQKAYILFYSKKDVAASETISRAISSLPTPPLSPFKNSSKMSLNFKKNSALTDHDKLVAKSAKERKNLEDSNRRDNIKEPKPIASQSSISPPSQGEVVKHLEEIADGVNINATSKTWKVLDRAKIVVNDPTERQISSKSKLLAPSLPDLMEHFSPVSVSSWNNSEYKSVSSEKKRKRKDAQDILYDQGKLPKYLKRQMANPNQVGKF